MKTAVGIGLIVLGLFLLMLGVKTQSSIANSERKAREVSSSVQDFNVAMSEFTTKIDTSYREPTAQSYSSAYLLYGIGAISALLGIFSFALPASATSGVTRRLPMQTADQQALGIMPQEEEEGIDPRMVIWFLIFVVPVLTVIGLVLLAILFN